MLLQSGNKMQSMGQLDHFLALQLSCLFLLGLLYYSSIPLNTFSSLRLAYSENFSSLRMKSWNFSTQDSLGLSFSWKMDFSMLLAVFFLTQLTKLMLYFSKLVRTLPMFLPCSSSSSTIRSMICYFSLRSFSSTILLRWVAVTTFLPLLLREEIREDWISSSILYEQLLSLSSKFGVPNNLFTPRSGERVRPQRGEVVGERRRGEIGFLSPKIRFFISLETYRFEGVGQGQGGRLSRRIFLWGLRGRLKNCKSSLLLIAYSLSRSFCNAFEQIYTSSSCSLLIIWLPSNLSNILERRPRESTAYCSASGLITPRILLYKEKGGKQKEEAKRYSIFAAI